MMGRHVNPPWGPSNARLRNEMLSHRKKGIIWDFKHGRDSNNGLLPLFPLTTECFLRISSLHACSKTLISFPHVQGLSHWDTQAPWLLPVIQWTKYLILLLLFLSTTPFPFKPTAITVTQNFLICDQLPPQAPFGSNLPLQYQYLLCRTHWALGRQHNRLDQWCLDVSVVLILLMQTPPH